MRWITEYRLIGSLPLFPDRVAIPDDLIDGKTADPYMFRVFAHLARLAGEANSHTIQASFRDIADHCGIGKSSVVSAVRRLEAAGFLSVSVPVTDDLARKSWAKRFKKERQVSVLYGRLARLLDWPCERCGGPTHHVHHRVPLSEGGANDLSNWERLCMDCHRAAHSRGGER